MNADSPTEPHPATNSLSSKRRYFPNKLGCAFAALAVVGLVFVLIPTYQCSDGFFLRNQAFGRARSIALALKLYASENEGLYPAAIGDPASEKPSTNTATDANAAFANLFPRYCSAERLFYVSASAYCNPKPPDEIFNKKGTCLAPGENAFGYVAGLTDTSNATLPLIVDGTDGRGHYVSDKTRRGGVWGGKCAIVIYVDSSGEIAKLAGPEDEHFIPRSREDKTHNLLDPNYLNIFQANLLDPVAKEKGNR